MIDWETYAAFHAESVASNEIDDVYPVLREFGNILDLTAEERAWLTFLYVAYYNINSTLQVFEKHRLPAIPEPGQLRLPTGIERRGHRVPERLHKHLSALMSIAESNNGLYEWIIRQVTGNPVESWNKVIATLETIPGNGRWASYKTAEMLWKINGLDLQAPDMGHANSTGPRQGLALLYKTLPTGNSREDIETLDRISLDVLARLKDLGVHANIEEAETSLCDLHALAEGKYYLGMDIDAMQENLLKCPSPLVQQMFEARARVIPHHYLGELTGRLGIDADRRRAFKQTGRLLFRTPE